ncbi:hypothetical protein [Roseobacter sp. CCS2]|uniref:hypothetical protein n=1 Tax=Roseobacter sp. CCS2 TaxID=391593 RepID=UPI0000F3C3E8|nr:hypothetical protein [Roseobacter sp. CCS2]EBA11799.1 hypothetical protein RCCS2_17761 [Roseobacter sp. CCS2]
MQLPILTDLPEAPSPSDTEEDFDVKAYTFTLALQPMVVEMREFGTALEVLQSNVAANAAAANLADVDFATIPDRLLKVNAAGTAVEGVAVNPDINLSNGPDEIAPRSTIEGAIDFKLASAFAQRQTSSTLQSFNGGFSYSTLHGLGARPRFWSFEVRCFVAEFGFAVGDIVPVVPNATTGSSSAFGFVATVSETRVDIKFANVASPIRVLRPDTGAAVSLTNANWGFRWHAAL